LKFKKKEELMNKVYFGIIFLAAFILAGCATTDKNIKPGCSSYTADLNGDGGLEIVEIEDKAEAGTGSGIELIVNERSKGKEKKKIDSITLEGKFTKLDLLELNNNGQKQIAVYSKVEDNATNLVIYRLQNNILSKMFDATSEYGIDVNSMGVITRIRLGKAASRQQTDSPNCVNDWETWVWTGDKFVKEQ
jgi:hypothetical protein